MIVHSMRQPLRDQMSIQLPSIVSGEVPDIFFLFVTLSCNTSIYIKRNNLTTGLGDEPFHSMNIKISTQ